VHQRQSLAKRASALAVILGVLHAIIVVSSFAIPPRVSYSTCMKPSVIVWDLETVPDLGGFAAANDLIGKSVVEVREAIGDKFPKRDLT
jgi:hypothetical protein